MKILNARVHGYIDFFVVIAFLAAPTLFDFSDMPAKLSYALAVIHLGLVLVTAYPYGIIKKVPFEVHGVIELLVSVGLVAFPWVLGFSSEDSTRNFYVAAGIAVFLTWLTTDYKSGTATDTGTAAASIR